MTGHRTVTHREPLRPPPQHGIGDMTNKDSDSDQAAQTQAARERMLARHKLIEAIIRNNELQLRNESARGGAEIEMHCALRDAELPDAGPEAAAELERLTARVAMLKTEHARLVAEREWLNAALLEFETGPSSAEHQRSGHA
jgi:hypothetical protein